jgi:hemoglobin
MLNASFRRHGRKLLLLVLTACSLQAAPTASAGTLYEDLGGEAGVIAVIDQFLWHLADDEKVSHYFVETNLERFRSKLIEYVCQVAAGPCTYSGDSMERTHANMGVSIADFNVTVESLMHAMQSQHIPTGVQNRLLKALALDYHKVVQNP